MRAPREGENKRSSALTPRQIGASLCNLSAPALPKPKELQESKEQKEHKGAGKENAPPPSSGAPLRVDAALVSQYAKDALQPSRMPLPSPSVPTRPHEAIVVGRSHNTNPPTCRVQGCQTRAEFKARDYYHCSQCSERVEVCPSCASTYAHAKFLCFACDISLHKAPPPHQPPETPSCLPPEMPPELSSELKVVAASPMANGRALEDPYASWAWSDDHSPLPSSSARDRRTVAPPQGGADAARARSTDSNSSSSETSVLHAISMADIEDLADLSPPGSPSSLNM